MSGNWPFLWTDRYPPPQDWKAQTWVFFYRWALRILKFIHQDSLKRKVSLSWRKRSLLLHHLLLLLLLVCPNFTIPCSAFLPHPPPEHVVDSLFKIISSKNGDWRLWFQGTKHVGSCPCKAHTKREAIFHLRGRPGNGILLLRGNAAILGNQVPALPCAHDDGFL